MGPTWYSFLPQHSIDSFEMLADSFIKAHSGARKVQARKADMFRIAQEESELLREFVTRFQKEKMLLPVVTDEWAPEAFTKGLNPRSSDTFRKLKESLLEFRATIWGDVHNRYESKIRIEDDQLDFTEKEISGSRVSTYPRLSEYNFNVSMVELVSMMRNIKEARFPRPMRSNPSQRDPNLWCEYHGTNGYRTGDCRQLREKVATLLKNGHL
nr:uncharacterized protein LOC104084749 [Nicotiana tomentosiformis]